MNKTTVFIERLRTYISKQKVVTIQDLMGHFNRSRATIFRVLNRIEHITSYNRNRSGITLPTTPEFDSWGLWKSEKFYFSRWKTLNETIQNIIDKSSAGLYPRELRDKLGVRIHNHLLMCVAENRIVRNNDFGHPVYFSRAAETRKRQYKERANIFRERMPHKKPPLSNENVIKVLVTIIKHHATNIKKLMPVLKNEGIHLSERSVKWVLQEYGIKKTRYP